ncbi:MAG: hypothetical protein RDV48_11260 [Candidatus Eremiobacteraeota bacterium]|nr:hypothetical protein [Candidatus Eremiobacteraeota bacterium]
MKTEITLTLGEIAEHEIIKALRSVAAQFNAAGGSLRIVFVGERTEHIEVSFEAPLEWHHTLEEHIIEALRRDLASKIRSCRVTFPERKVFAAERKGESSEGGLLEFAALAVKERAIVCRNLTTGEPVTLRHSSTAEVVEGEVLSVVPNRAWTFKRTQFLSGEIKAHRIDVKALRLIPLKLFSRGMWEPDKEIRWDPDDPEADILQSIQAAGPRPLFEMENAIDDLCEVRSDSHPILRAIECHEGGDNRQARSILKELLAKDLRCLDAHCLLGMWLIEDTECEYTLRLAARHFETAIEIGNIALEEGFNCVLCSSYNGNRPYLECLKEYGIVLWRLGDFQKALSTLTGLLWLDPANHFRTSQVIDDLKSGRPWESSL